METKISPEELQRKEDAKKKIAKLVYEFKKDIVDTGRIKNYNEENVKVHFITPLFKALGWNMSNQNEVLYEENIYRKRADYLFILNGKRSMIVEAKQPSKNLSSGTTSGDSVAKQAISYAWHTQIPIAVVTDFEEILVYHALAKPFTISKNLMLIKNKDFSLKFTDFIDKFELLWLLSKDSFENNRLDNYLKRDVKKHKTVDESILDDLVDFRIWLSKDFKKYNTDLTKDEIDELVQKLIDRLIFIRCVEDRNLEQKRDWLLSIVTNAKEQILSKTIIAELKTLFKHFDKVYNSKLFSKDAKLDIEIRLSNEVLSKVIMGLYFGTGSGRFRYEFDQISVDLLGSIYEQYLGMLLYSTEKRVKLESVKSKRKNLGIYYTPQYIVDYIVRNTIGEAVKGKTIEEILQLKILDPSCGSGSFLLRAFDEMCTAVKVRLGDGDKSGLSIKELRKDGKLYLAQKIFILKNCIFGIDLDEQAVELAQLALLLKLLEDESSETKKQLLPTMKNNILNGNSLIDDSQVSKLKAFNWEANFKEVIDKDKFDIIIGNPPYGAKFNELEKKYFKKNYDCHRSGNSAAYFMERSINMSDNYVGFILPKTISFYSSWKDIRNYMLHKGRITSLLDVGIAFQDANYEELVIIHSQRSKNQYVKIDVAEPIKRFKSEKKISPLGKTPLDLLKKEETIISVPINDVTYALLTKIDRKSITLGTIAEDIFRGLYIPDKDKLQLKNGNYKFISKVPWVKRYFLSKYINIDIAGNDKWLKRANRIMKPRLFFKVLRGNRLVVYADVEGKLLTTEKLVNLILKPNVEYSLGFLMAYLNSKVPSFYLEKVLFSDSTETSRVMDSMYSSVIPIPKVSENKQKKIELLAKKILESNIALSKETSSNKRELITRQIKQADYEIEQTIYDIYSLTKEEKNIIETYFK